MKHGAEWTDCRPHMECDLGLIKPHSYGVLIWKVGHRPELELRCDKGKGVRVYVFNLDDVSMKQVHTAMKAGDHEIARIVHAMLGNWRQVRVPIATGGASELAIVYANDSDDHVAVNTRIWRRSRQHQQQGQQQGGGCGCLALLGLIPLGVLL